MEGIYFIQCGNVKIISKGADKKEQIVRLATVGQALGHRGNGDDEYPVSAIALTGTVVCFFDNNTFNDVLMNNPELAVNLMMFYSRELRKAEIRMKYLMQMNVIEKVVEALLLLKETFGMNEESKCLNISLSRREIAEMIGVTAEQVSREVIILEKRKLISRYKENRIKLIDVPGLKEIIRKYGIEQYAEQK